MRLDTDFDGRITRGEQLARPLYRDILAAADKNGDGIVTRDEVAEELRRRMDANGDGFVSWEEALKYNIRMRP